MRILCIHGNAINSTIFQAKTERLRSLLPQDYSFDWFDGQYPTVPRKELSDVYPGPHLSHFEDLTTHGVARAISEMQDFIDGNGPFDGIMGICEV